MSTQPKHLLTPEEYLEIERKAEFKSEYFNGEMFARAGAGESHNLLVGNLYTLLRTQLRPRGCRIYTNDMRVRVSETGIYTYPDVVVVCTEPEFLDQKRDTLLNPAVVFEVISPSTEAYDRGQKFEYYKRIGSLRSYLLIASTRLSVEHRYRHNQGPWTLDLWTEAGQKFDLPSINATLDLSEIYEGVELT